MAPMIVAGISPCYASGVISRRASPAASGNGLAAVRAAPSARAPLRSRCRLAPCCSVQPRRDENGLAALRDLGFVAAVDSAATASRPSPGPNGGFDAPSSPRTFQSMLASAGTRMLAIAAGAVILGALSPGLATAASSSGRAGGNSFRTSATSSSASSYSAHSTHSSTTVVAAGPATHHHTTVVVAAPTPAPVIGFGFMPMMPMMPFGVPHYHSGPSIFGILFAVLAVILAVFAISSLLNRSSQEEEELVYGGPCSVLKVQVGLLGMARGLQRDIESIAMSSDTSHPEGLHSMLQETVLALMRHPEYAVYAHSSSERVKSMDEAEGRFNQLSLTERSRTKGESVSNIAGYVSESSPKPASLASGDTNELFMITIVAATDGTLDIPPISNFQTLKDALSTLGSVSPDRLLAVELLWTPQREGDTLSQKDVIVDYPHLVAL